MPDLVRLEESRRDLVHELELFVERQLQGHHGLVSVLPDGNRNGVDSLEAARNMDNVVWVGVDERGIECATHHGV